MTTQAERIDLAAHLRDVSMGSHKTSSPTTEWIRKFDSEQSCYHWFNARTGATVDTDPFRFASPQEVPPEMRNKWFQVYDEREQRVLWVNPSLTREQWVDPEKTAVSNDLP